jgi:hypothetical protein
MRNGRLGPFDLAHRKSSVPYRRVSWTLGLTMSRVEAFVSEFHSLSPVHILVRYLTDTD